MSNVNISLLWELYYEEKYQVLHGKSMIAQILSSKDFESAYN
jgi:hypothetical protein